MSSAAAAADPPAPSPAPSESTAVEGEVVATPDPSAPPLHPSTHAPLDADAPVAPEGAFGQESKYERLHHLLDQTSLFSKFLSERMPTRYAASAQKAARATADEKASQLSERATALRKLIPDASLQLKPFQVAGVDWLISLYENGLNGILADEMGLGKTIQVLIFLAHLRSHRVFGPFIIVAPLGTLPGWKAECERWTPSVPVLLYHGDKASRAALRSEVLSRSGQPDESFPVVLTSYEIAMNDAAFLKRTHWKLLCVDEGHRLKNLECLLLQKLQSFPSENRLLLTGTPLQNSLLELWSLLHFLLPDIFSSLSQFQSWFAFDGATLAQQEGQEAVIDAERDNLLVTKLHTILRPFVLRRVKADVLSKMPSKTEYAVFVPLTPLQRMFYQAILDGELSALTSHSTNNALMQLRKVCNHPYLLISDEEERARGMDLLALAKRREEGGGEDDASTSTASILRLIRGQAVSSRAMSEEEELALTLEESKEQVLAAATAAEDDGWETVAQRNKRRKTASGAVAAAAAARNNAAAAAQPATPAPSFPAERLVEVCGKLQFLDQLLPALRARGNRVLIFSQMTRVLDVLEDYLSLRGESRYCRIDGTTPSADRAAQITAFNSDPSLFVFLLSTRAGGLGINLASADTVVLFDSDFNPTVDAQAADRAHRLTQQRPVLVLRLLSPGTVEMAMHARANSKKTLEQLVLTKGRFHTGAAMSADEQKDAAAAAAAASVSAPAAASSSHLGAADWRRQTSIVHELVELFRGTRTGSTSLAPMQMDFASASPAAAAAANRAAQNAAPPTELRRNNSLKRKSSSRASSAAAAVAPPIFDPAVLERLLDRSREAPADALPATPLQSGFERVHAAQRSAIDRITDAHAEEIAL